MAKSPGFAPVNPMLLMETVALLALVKVALLGPPALPTATWYQESDVGEALTCAEASDHAERTPLTRTSNAAFRRMPVNFERGRIQGQTQE
jgi:hypothetical protein